MKENYITILLSFIGANFILFFSMIGTIFMQFDYWPAFRFLLLFEFLILMEAGLVIVYLLMIQRPVRNLYIALFQIIGVIPLAFGVWLLDAISQVA
jgi:hypothetical protein